MSEDFNFIKIEAYDGIHYIRKHLINSISHYNQQIFPNGVEPVDVNTILVYDNGEIFYFLENPEAVIEMLKGEW